MENLLTPEQVSEILGVTTHTLAQWRSQKSQSLAYAKVGRHVRYRPVDVESFVNSRIQTA